MEKKSAGNESFECRVHTEALIVVGKESLRLLESRGWQVGGQHQEDLVDHSEARSGMEGCRGREATQRGKKKV